VYQLWRINFEVKTLKFLLIYPPAIWSSAGQNPTLSGSTVPPLGLLYIAKVLEDNGNKVEIIDYSAENVDRKKLEKSVKSSDAVGLTILTITLSNSKQLIKLIKEMDKNKPVIIGGPHCSLYPEKSLIELDADISVQGDGETVINEISLALQGKKHLSEIPGVYFRDKKNNIKSGPEAKLIKNLDAVSFPSRHLVKKYQYGKMYKPDVKKEKFTSIITSRGCPHQCKYCTRQFFGMKKYRLRSKENVINELKELKENGYEYVVITDDSFLSNSKRAYQIMDDIVNEKLEFQIFIQGARVDCAEEKLYLKMKEAGVKAISFGIESGNQDILDFYNKKTTLSQIRKAVNLSRKMNFYTMGSFIFGAPFETEKHFENTIKFARSLPLNVAVFFPLEYRAGSELWENAKKEGKINSDEYCVPADLNRELAMFSNEEISLYCQQAQKKFYFRPSYILNEFIQGCKRKDFSFNKVELRVLFENASKFLK